MRELETLLVHLRATTSRSLIHLSLSNEMLAAISQEAITMSNILWSNQDSWPRSLTSLVEGIMQVSQDYVKLSHDFKE